jgi:hypothetical protein
VPRHPRGDEKHYQQLVHRLAPPFIREVLAALRSGQVTALAAAAELALGRTRFYELYADYLRACATRRQHSWVPGSSGGDHAAPWPAEVEPLLRKLLSSRPPASYSLAASEVKRRLHFHLDPATVRRFAMAHDLAPPRPARKAKASVRRWQCSKIGALWQLDATPHRWWPGGPPLPLLNMLDDCSRRRVGAQIYPTESLLAYLDFLPRAFLAHGLPLRLYVDCHSFFLSSVPDALTQLGAALHFYGITFRYASSPQAKGKIERSHQDWQNRLPALCAAEDIASIGPANPCSKNSAPIATPMSATANSAALRSPPGSSPKSRAAARCARRPNAHGGPTSSASAPPSKSSPTAASPQAARASASTLHPPLASSTASTQTATSPSSATPQLTAQDLNSFSTSRPPLEKTVRLCSQASVRLCSPYHRSAHSPCLRSAPS